MELTGKSFAFGFEQPLMEWLQAHISSTGIRVISAFSMFGEALLMVLILGFLYWSWDKKMGKYIGLNVLAALVWNAMIKNVFVRRRPYFDDERIAILRPVEPGADLYDIRAQGYSFPSGHSANAAVMYGSAAVYGKKRWIRAAAVILPLLVGFSRVVVGAHYPSDVLGGWLLGLAVIWILPWLYRKIDNKVLLYALLIALALPGLFYCRSTDYFTGLGLLIGFVLGTAFEERYVRFENTRKPVAAVLRVAGGLAVYLLLDVLLKLPFSADFLGSGSMAALMVRCARYGIIAFLDFGVYPMAFVWI